MRLENELHRRRQLALSIRSNGKKVILGSFNVLDGRRAGYEMIPIYNTDIVTIVVFITGFWNDAFSSRENIGFFFRNLTTLFTIFTFTSIRRTWHVYEPPRVDDLLTYVTPTWIKKKKKIRTIICISFTDTRDTATHAAGSIYSLWKWDSLITLWHVKTLHTYNPYAISIRVSLWLCYGWYYNITRKSYAYRELLPDYTAQRPDETQCIIYSLYFFSIR